MNYSKHYERLIERARTRMLDSYTETHHIVPRCVGGTNDLENLVELTPEEHFLAHQLLVKIYPGNRGLLYAVVAMSGHNIRIGNKQYGWIRRKYSKMMSETMLGNKSRTGMTNSEHMKKRTSETHKGVPKTAEHRRKISEGQQGKILSEDHKRKLSVANKGKIQTEESKRKNSESNKGRIISQEHRDKISKSCKGRIPWNVGVPTSDAAKEKISKIHKGKSKPTKTCPHCGKNGSFNNMNRWHFDNCKSIIHNY
jgi:hypothetical protein